MIEFKIKFSLPIRFITFLLYQNYITMINYSHLYSTQAYCFIYEEVCLSGVFVVFSIFLFRFYNNYWIHTILIGLQRKLPLIFPQYSNILRIYKEGRESIGRRVENINEIFPLIRFQDRFRWNIIRGDYFRNNHNNHF